MASCAGYAEDLGVVTDAATGVQLTYSTTFSTSALPTPQDLARNSSGDLAPEAEKFVTYITSGLLQVANRQGKCGSCWAFGIAEALQYATELAYRRLHRFFTPSYMSVQYLLSCYDRQDRMCGCRGGDLAEAFAIVGREGTVLEQLFKYDNSEDTKQSVVPDDLICAQNAGRFLGTCRPCKPGERPSVSAGTVSCIPCAAAPFPRYFPSEPFRVSGEDVPLEQRVRAIKQELRRIGPLCGVLGVNSEAIRGLAGANGKVVRRVGEAPVYSPASVSRTAVKHAVLIVGYYDPWVSDKRDVSRRSAAVWICRNSWGPEWGYRVPTVRLVAGRGPGDPPSVVPSVLGGFFNVSMYDHADEIGLVNATVAFRQVLVRFPGDASPRPLRADDPFTARLPDLTGVRSAPLRGDVLSGVESQGSHPAPWLARALAVLVAVLAAVLALWE